jgi:DNA-binding CsgD family transcriptional regulator
MLPGHMALREPGSARRAKRSPGEAPFVGRAWEFRQLASRLLAAREGSRQLVMLDGPAGIGKTRLAEEFTARPAVRRQCSIAVGRCWRNADTPPASPWQTVCRTLGAPEELLAQCAPEAGAERFARFGAVLDHLGRMARGTLPLIVLDDFHLADRETVLLTRFLIRERRSPSWFLLLIRRDGAIPHSHEADDVWQDLSRDGTTITLGGLTERAVSAYLAGCGLRDGNGLARGLVTITGGNPLSLRGIVRPGRRNGSPRTSGLEETIDRIVGQLQGEDARCVALAAVLGMTVSSHEVARLAATSPSLVAVSLTRAVAAGVMQPTEDDRATAFVDPRLRDRALASLTPGERFDAYARAARLSTGPDPDRALRRAQYAFGAASRSMEDAAFAIATAREAAAVQGPERLAPVATLLRQAVELHDAAALGGPAASLIVEAAEAVLACGRLAESRPLFHRAAQLAEAEGNEEVFARAAIGLGGVWVREHRFAVEAEGVMALQRRALDALPREAHVLRGRLTVRLAAEATYRGAPLDPVREAVEAVRRTGDARALAEALSLYHHALLIPQHTWRRLDVASELIATAAAAGDGLLALMGLCWRTADLFLLGDRTAEAALADLRHSAERLGCQGVLFIVRSLEVMLAIRGGRFAEAEELAAACHKLGVEVGDADALAIYGGHIAAIRGFQGRDPELADTAMSIATSPSVIEREAIFTFASALYAARAGRLEPARALLEVVRRDGVGSIRQTSAWLVTLRVVVELAALLDDAVVAESAYETLRPYAELPIMASVGVVCFGSTHRSLGVAALTGGKLDVAIEHFGAAVTVNERLGHRPAAVQARAELGMALLRRGEPDGTARGQTLLDGAVAEADSLQMTGLIARWRAAAAKIEASPHRLSPRLRQTLACLVEGNSEKQVAAELGVSPTTVHQYVTALYRHFGVRSRGELLARVLKRSAR